MPKVSVIVPVYGAENFIERCARSLFEQTLDDIEYIFVNDCTPDRSMEILKNVLSNYPSRRDQVKIINHEHNQGQAGARTTGMKAAAGEYMIHCDPDDWVETDMYEQLYLLAIEHKADIVTCGIIHHEKNGTVWKSFLQYCPTPRLSLKYLYLKHHRSCFLWNKLIRTKLIKSNNIYPFEGINFGEDQNVVIRVLYYANTFYHSKDAFYHYNHNNENSATNNRRTTSKWSKWKENVDKMCSFMMAVDPINFETTCNYFKFDAKMFYMSAFDNTKEWFNLYRECHKDIMKFNEYSLRARLILKIILSDYLVFSMYKKLKTRKNSTTHR
jgi:hypothetical protein BACCOPRO_00944